MAHSSQINLRSLFTSRLFTKFWMRGITRDSGITQASGNTAAPITHKLGFSGKASTYTQEVESGENIPRLQSPPFPKSCQGSPYPNPIRRKKTLRAHSCCPERSPMMENSNVEYIKWVKFKIQWFSMAKSKISLGKCHTALENVCVIFNYLLILISNIISQ